MKAIRFHATGGPEVLRWEDIDLPPPGPGQIRVRHAAVAVNFRDILVRRGQHPPAALPSGLGMESAGTVEALGPDVEGFAVSERVACVAGPDNAYAQARNIPAARAVKIPDAIDDRTAASMMVRGMTAHYLLHGTYRVQRGNTVLVHAAAGGVGLILCQWAKHLGATVIGTVGSRDKEVVARAHGCDHVFGYDDFAERTRELTGGLGVPAVYDSVGRTTLKGSMRAAARRGIVASYGEASGDPEPVAPGALGPLGSIFLTHPRLPDYTATRAELLKAAGDLFDVVATGKVKIDINHAYPLAEAAQAHRDLEGRKTTGSVVLIP